MTLLATYYIILLVTYYTVKYGITYDIYNIQILHTAITGVILLLSSLETKPITQTVSLRELS